MLQTICLPEFETKPGANCFTTGINKESKRHNTGINQEYNKKHEYKRNNKKYNRNKQGINQE